MFAGFSSFKEMANAVVIVVILVAMAFICGYCKGEESGRNKINSRPAETPTNVLPDLPTADTSTPSPRPSSTPLPTDTPKRKSTPATSMPGTSPTPTPALSMPKVDNTPLPRSSSTPLPKQ